MKLSTVIQPCNEGQLMSNGKNWPTIRSFGLIDIGEQQHCCHYCHC
jgi:hypothetical protein